MDNSFPTYSPNVFFVMKFRGKNKMPCLEPCRETIHSFLAINSRPLSGNNKKLGLTFWRNVTEREAVYPRSLLCVARGERLCHVSVFNLLKDRNRCTPEESSASMLKYISSEVRSDGL